MAKKPKAVTWSDLSFEQRKEQLTALWNDEGLSDNEIARRLGATKGQIVGFRHRYLPDVTGETRGQTGTSPQSASEEEPPPLTQQLPAPPVPAQPILAVPRSPPVQESTMQISGVREQTTKPKMAASEATQCDHRDPDDKQRCGFEWTVRKRDGKFCTRHAPLYS